MLDSCTENNIITVTGPVARFARQIAGQGYICAAPSSYHEFTGPEALKYDAEDTDKGNAWKIGKVRKANIVHQLHRRYFYDPFTLFFFFPLGLPKLIALETRGL
jgi:hypothetical protein